MPRGVDLHVDQTSRDKQDCGGAVLTGTKPLLPRPPISGLVPVKTLDGVAGGSFLMREAAEPGWEQNCSH